MALAEDTVQPLVTLSEAHAFLRLEVGDDEALLAGLIRTSSALCEQFVGQIIIRREFRELLRVSGDWQSLRSFPVVSITSLNVLDVSGAPVLVGSTDLAVDIDADGRGWVRCVAVPARVQLEVHGTAGLAANANQVPEPLRQGVLRLVAHLHANRDGSGGEPPAAVTALWRPYRRLALR